MYEENILFDEYPDVEGVATDTDASSVDYEILGDTIYVNTYNAMSDYYSEHPELLLSSGLLSTSSDDVASSVVEFSSDTDATLYTVETVGSPTSVAEQEVAILLDCRNILLIFLFVYFIVSMYGKLKSTLMNYYERD